MLSKSSFGIMFDIFVPRIDGMIMRLFLGRGRDGYLRKYKRGTGASLYPVLAQMRLLMGSEPSRSVQKVASQGCRADNTRNAIPT